MTVWEVDYLFGTLCRTLAAGELELCYPPANLPIFLGIETLPSTRAKSMFAEFTCVVSSYFLTGFTAITALLPIRIVLLLWVSKLPEAR